MISSESASYIRPTGLAIQGNRIRILNSIEQFCTLSGLLDSHRETLVGNTITEVHTMHPEEAMQRWSVFTRHLGMAR